MKLYQLPGDPYWQWRTDVMCPNPELDCSECQDCVNEGEAIIRPKGIKNDNDNSGE